MNYYLHDRGKNLGVFPLEELRNRRNTGGLTGQEMVWCSGMSNWQTLDSVLSPKRKASNGALFAAIAGGAVVFIAIVVGVGTAANRFVNQVQHVAGAGTYASRRKSALTLASAPVVWNSNTLTAKDVQLKRREFCERQYLQNYQRAADHSSPTDGDNLRLINAWLAHYYGTDEEKTNLPSLVELSDKLAADPNCKDPFVLTVAGVEAVQYQTALRRLERAVEGFRGSKYAGYPKCYATVRLSDRLDNESRGRQRELDAEAEEYLKEAFRDRSIRAEDQDEVAQALVNGWGRSFFARNAPAVLATVKDQRKPFQWLALVLEGNSEIEQAWKARGDGYANTVSEAGWQGFRDHLARARVCLSDAWDLKPNLPLAAELMMKVSLGNSTLADMRVWFDRAVTAQIDDTNAWSEMRWGLRPRWGGDLNSMRAFGLTALHAKRFDTSVPFQFFDSVSDMESELNGPPGQHIYGRGDIWPNLQQMYEGYIGQATSQQKGWRSAYSAAAYLAGKYPAARTQLEVLNWKPDYRNLLGWHTDMSLMTSEVAARTRTAWHSN